LLNQHTKTINLNCCRLPAIPCPIQTSHILINHNSQSMRNYEMRNEVNNYMRH
ncbi:hypothetical protein L9F63_022556, partial [Diploptera punctata]